MNATAAIPAETLNRSKPESSERWTDAEFLPCQISVEIEVPRFTVRNLFGLEINSIIDTHWGQGSDVPLKANAHVIGWAEFEVIEDRLAVRLTELY
jgi:flagellar motor switch protein FliN